MRPIVSSFAVAGILALTFGSSEAFAAAKAPPGYENGNDKHYGYVYSKVPLVESHKMALDRAWINVEQHIDGDYDRLKVAANEFDASARRANEERRKWENQIAVQRGALSAEQAKYEDLGKRVQRSLAEEPGAEPLETVKKQLDDSMTRLVTEKKKLKELEAGFGAAKQASEEVLARARTDLAKFDSSIAKYDGGIQFKKDATPEEVRANLARLENNVLKKMKLDSSKDVVEQMYDKTKDDLMETKMLFSDFETLEKDLKLTGHRMQAFMEVTAKRLDKTLMGRYLDDKIREQFCRLQLQKPVCAMEAISDAGQAKPERPLGVGPGAGEGPRGPASFKGN
ncbi:MAG: hypothetical protein NDJ90_10315 [Oligoflexia bacterium]|nr:hypothetical protein [Oligoflexia bacterium]